MAEHLLIIDTDEPFFLSVEGSNLILGAEPGQAILALSGLRIRRIRCDVEVEDNQVAVFETDAEEPSLRLHPGEDLIRGHIHLRMVAEASKAEAPQKIESAATPAGQPRRLVVVDGADRGKMFDVNSSGVTRVGKNQKSAHVCLNDIYVSQVQCELDVQGEQVFVTHLDGSSGTLINRKRIEGRQELLVGDVLRVGNSHLRLEVGAAEKPRLGHGSGEKSVLRDNSPVKFEGPKSDAAAPPKEPTAEEKLLQLENQVLGHYQIGGILGRGQFGVVFRAQDAKTNQTVALKVLSLEFPKNDAELQTFARVLKSAPALRHPHLVPLLGVGKTGLFTWIAREFVEGDNLQQLIARVVEEGKLGWKRACRVGVHLAQALEFLHQHRVVHGNLTPANILFRAEDKSTKIADVLLAQALHGSQLQQAVNEKKRRAEQAYMAPEQLEGSLLPDPCTDLYSLGAILYFVAMGQPPFAAHSPPELLANIRDGKCIKLSKRHKDVPAPLEAAVYKLLSADPDDRQQSVSEVLEVLEPIVMMHDIKL